MIARNHAWEHPDTARVQLYQRVFEREVLLLHNTCKSRVVGLWVRCISTFRERVLFGQRK